jgi:hypothetical protein
MYASLLMPEIIRVYGYSVSLFARPSNQFGGFETVGRVNELLDNSLPREW